MIDVVKLSQECGLIPGYATRKFAAAMIEQCAQVCDAVAAKYGEERDFQREHGADDCATAIRALKPTEGKP